MLNGIKATANKGVSFKELSLRDIFITRKDDGEGGYDMVPVIAAISNVDTTVDGAQRNVSAQQTAQKETLLNDKRTRETIQKTEDLSSPMDVYTTEERKRRALASLLPQKLDDGAANGRDWSERIRKRNELLPLQFVRD